MALLDFLFMRSKKGVVALANFTGTKVEKIEEMVTEVRLADPERHRQLVLGLNAWEHDQEALKMAATTFFIYRTFLRNRHPNEFEWWYNEFRKRDVIPEQITLRELEIASVTLRKIGLGVEMLPEAQAFYREMLKGLLEEEDEEETLEEEAKTDDQNSDHSGLTRECVSEGVEFELHSYDSSVRPQVVETLTFLLNQQLFLSEAPDIKNLLCEDMFVSGYITHFCAVGSHKMAMIELTSDQTGPYTRAVLANILNAQNLVEPVLDEIRSLRALPAYHEGRNAANEDIFEWIETSGKKVPMGLSRHLN